MSGDNHYIMSRLTISVFSHEHGTDASLDASEMKFGL